MCIRDSRQVEYMDLQTWGYLGTGFKGSAIISATHWEHEVFDPEGFFLRSLVGLGAVSVERSGTRLGEDVPGDEAAGDRGIPFTNDPARDEPFAYCFAGPAVAFCPCLLYTSWQGLQRLFDMTTMYRTLRPALTP